MVLWRRKAGKEVSEEQKWAIIGIGVFSLGMLVAIGLLGYSAISYTSTLGRYNKAVKQMNDLQVVKAVYDKYQEATDLATQVDGMYAITENSNEALINFIEEMEDKMPEDFVVTSLSANTVTVTMQIEVNSKEAAAKVVQQFRSFDTVAAVAATSYSSDKDEEGNEKVTFALTITYGQNPNAVVTE